ncbi:MAG: DegV family protein [Anaerolineae bacterium]|nr:MAG: DegV family protein [Anaerolineae bacterium]
MPRDLVRQYQIKIVPLNLLWDGKLYKDTIDITPDQFYQRLNQAPRLPTTSPPAVEDLVALYNQLAETHDGILSIHLSGEYSRTVDMARYAARQVQVPVEVIDSRSVSMGLGFVVLAAARPPQGPPWPKPRPRHALIPRIQVRMFVESLRYLHLGGRIGAAQRWVGTALDQKPILSVQDGQTGVVGQARGRKAALKALIDQVAMYASGHSLHIAVVHSLAALDALWLYDQVEEDFNCVEHYYVELVSVLGTPRGSGCVGVAFYVE